MPNERTVVCELKRIDLCDLKMACILIHNMTEKENTKWYRLNEKLSVILKDFDEVQGIE